MYNQSGQSFFFNPVRALVTFFFAGIVFLPLFSCRHSLPAEQYGFLTRLGNDTVAVERVTRQGNTLTIDAVDRFPRVRVRHSVIELDSNGRIQHLEMDIHTPSEPANARERKVIADVTANTVHLSKTDGTGTLKRDFAMDGSAVVAHVPQLYSLYELYFAAAQKNDATSKTLTGTTVPLRQFYIDREFDRFPLGHAQVRLLGNGKAEITHDWLSGTGEATLDSTGHLLSYSGARTTYKVKVNRLASPPDIKNIADHIEAQETKAGPAREMSVRDTVRAQIGNATFVVEYSRPLVRERRLLGEVIPYDRVWRTGANAATQFTTSTPITLAGIQVPSGTYTLWTVPHVDAVDLIVNKQTGQWGTEYNSAQNLGIAKMTSQVLQTPVEAFTISVVAANVQQGSLVMEWGTFRWTAPIEVP